MTYNLNAVLRPKHFLKCQKCNQEAEYIGKVNGELEYALCVKHYKKRNENKFGDTIKSKRA